jgi:hypothetical protein
MLDFLGIGAQKAGTTWLYERLSQHPAVRFPAGYPPRGSAVCGYQQPPWWFAPLVFLTISMEGG